jgi:hypothetical protein
VIEIQAKKLTPNQKLIACALVRESTNVSPAVEAIFLSGLGYSEVPDLSSPSLVAIREICVFGNASEYKMEDVQSRYVFLRVLNQMDDFQIAVGFIAEISVVLGLLVEGDGSGMKLGKINSRLS